MVRTYDGEKEMKIRKNRKRALARLAHNNHGLWYITPFMVKAEMVRKTNERIRAIIDATFPEFA